MASFGKGSGPDPACNLTKLKDAFLLLFVSNLFDFVGLGEPPEGLAKLVEALQSPKTKTLAKPPMCPPQTQETKTLMCQIKVEPARL